MSDRQVRPLEEAIALAKHAAARHRRDRVAEVYVGLVIDAGEAVERVGRTTQRAETNVIACIERAEYLANRLLGASEQMKEELAAFDAADAEEILRRQAQAEAPKIIPGDLYISLHTADPGEAGTQLTSEATYTDYARAGGK